MKARREREWLDTVSTAERRILDLRSAGMRHAMALGRLHYPRASPPLPEQCHRRWLVLVFLFSGQQRYRVDGEEVAVRGGQMLRILPGERYGTGDWPEQKGELAWLIVDTGRRRGQAVLGMTAAGAGAVLSLLADRARPRVCPLPGGAALAVEEAFRWWPRRQELLGGEMVRNRVAALVLGAAAVLGQAPDAPAAAADEPRVGQVLRWLEQHPDARSTTAELAALAGLSPTSFHAHFKRATGCSPRDYQLRRLVERGAARMLANPVLCVTRVAHDLGFSSSQYFATVFRRYLGVAPTAYRRKHHDRHQERRAGLAQPKHEQGQRKP